MGTASVMGCSFPSKAKKFWRKCGIMCVLLISAGGRGAGFRHGCTLHAILQPGSPPGIRVGLNNVSIW